MEAELLRQLGEDEIAQLREENDPQFDERWDRGARSLCGTGRLSVVILVGREDLETLIRHPNPERVARLIRHLIAEQRLEKLLD